MTAIQEPATTPWPTDLSAYCFEVPYSDESILFESAKGLRLTDAAGRGYLDGLSGVFVTCFGYDSQPIVDAMTAQLHRMPFNPPLHGTNQAALDLTAALVDLAPDGLSSVKLVNGGSEAIEAALRLSRFYHRSQGNPGRYKVLSYYHGYHGATFGSLTVTGRPDTTRFGPGLPGIVHVWPPDCLETFLGVSPQDSGEMAAQLIERTIEAEGPDSVAALVLEPVIHLLGMAVSPDKFLPRLREICDRHDIILIFDEIVTGFGRTGHPFAAQAFGATPDIICLGKGVSGGYAPLAAVLMSDRITGALETPNGTAAFAPSHTYAANPMSAAAGLAAVRLFHELDVPLRVQTLARHLRPLLERTVGGRGTVRGIGLLYGVKFTGDPAAGEKVAKECLRRGLIIRGQDNWIVLAPAFIAETSDLDEIASILAGVLDDVLGAAA